MMHARPASLRGAFLLEALVALVVFSLALLALAVATAHALRQVGAGRWRGEAVDVAATTLAQMSAEDASTLASRYDAADDGDGYRALLYRALHLPGVSATSNAPEVTIDDDAESRHIRVTLSWQLPGDPRVHHASLSGVVPLP